MDVWISFITTFHNFVGDDDSLIYHFIIIIPFTFCVIVWICISCCVSDRGVLFSSCWRKQEKSFCCQRKLLSTPPKCQLDRSFVIRITILYCYAHFLTLNLALCLCSCEIHKWWFFLFLLSLLCIIIDSENNVIMAGKIIAIKIIGLCRFIHSFINTWLKV